MRISDWSSDVCSSDLLTGVRASIGARGARLDLEQTRAADAGAAREIDRSAIEDTDITAAITELQKKMTNQQATQASFTKHNIGRRYRRERVGQEVEISVGAGSE